jgi:predicted metalloprotease with PDZ domain
MPRSIPGAYGIVNYENFIEELYVIGSDGVRRPMVKYPNGAPRWYFRDSILVKQIEYEVDLKNMEKRLASSDASIVRSGFVGILNYSVFGWIEGTEKMPIRCSVQTFSNWPIFCSNVPTASMSTGSFSFSANDYSTLADGQLFMGTKLRVKRYEGIVPLFIASYSETADEYLDDYGKQGTMSLDMLNTYFGELPFKEYSILLRKALPLDGVGSMAFGMEHLQSSTFLGDTSEYRKGPISNNQITETIDTYLHHMAHSFIPLRSYGDNYRPFVKEIPPIINNIWFNEGFMWFVPYQLLHSNDLRQWFERNCYKANPTIKEMSLQELSQTASMMYATDFRLGMAVVARGAMMAIEMNSYLEKKSSGKKSMQDVIKYIYRWSKDKNRPFELKEFPLLINQACGIDLTMIYNKWQLPIK